ncbi:MAG: hypothetical protein ABJC24_05290 [Chloroflexota bacterium]
MLNNILTTGSTDELRRPVGGNRLDQGAARLNSWLNWRPKQPARYHVLTVAELAECNCPDLCDRDHPNE